jgi:hypothetical protein
MIRRTLFGLWLVGTLLISADRTASGHVGPHPSIHDTTAAILNRMKRELTQKELRNLTVARAESFLNAQEREILGACHVSFVVNVPVTVFIIRPAALKDQPFWLKERQFQLTSFKAKVDQDEFDVWQKEFDAGWIGLGVRRRSAN